MPSHRSPVVTDHDSTFSGSERENPRIAHRQFSRCFEIEKINRWLKRSQAIRDSGIKVLIGEELNTHERFDPNWRLAASNRAKRAGFVLLSGTAARSNSRSASSRYSSIRVLFSR